jgi:hypothetical protein
LVSPLSLQLVQTKFQVRLRFLTPHFLSGLILIFPVHDQGHFVNETSIILIYLGELLLLGQLSLLLATQLMMLGCKQLFIYLRFGGGDITHQR